MAHNPVDSVASDGVLDIVLAAYRQAMENSNIEPDDDFFEIGVGSVQAMNVLAILEEKTGARINFGDFFSCPTAAELAAVIRTSDTSQ